MNQEAVRQPSRAPAPVGSSRRLWVAAAAVVALMWWSPGVAVMVVGLVVIIVVHELGHLIVARLAGVDASELSVGVGPLVFSRRWRGIAWSVRAIPVGAFVRVSGMGAGDSVPSDREAFTFRQAKLSKRLGIVLAGPAMNIMLAAVLLFVSLVVWGKVDPAHWEVADVAAGSPAARAGIRPGDRVIEVEGRGVATVGEMIARLADRGGKDTRLTVKDLEGNQRSLVVVPDTRIAVWGTVGEDLELLVRDKVVRVGATADGGVVAQAGLRRGDLVVQVNGVAVADAADISDAVKSADRGIVAVEVDRGGQRSSHLVNMGSMVAVSPTQGVLGVVPQTPVVPMPFAEAVSETGFQLVQVGGAAITGVARVLWPPNLVSFIASAVDTAGPPVAAPAGGSEVDPNRLLSVVGAVGLGARFADVSFGAALWFLGMLSLFIAVFNLIPVPPFDGGRAVVALYESIRERMDPRRQRHLVDERVLWWFEAAVLTILIGVGLAAVWLDITAPVG